jgi:prephenate dehydratase
MTHSINRVVVLTSSMHPALVFLNVRHECTGLRGATVLKTTANDQAFVKLAVMKAPQKSAPRRRFTIQEKLDILDKSKHLSLPDASRECNVPRYCIREWREKEHQLRRTCPSRYRCALPVEQGNTLLERNSETKRNAELIRNPLSTETHWDENAHSDRDVSEDNKHEPLVLIGYAGQQSTLADIAAKRAFPLLHDSIIAQAIRTVGFASATDVFKTIARDEIDYGIIPTSTLLSVSLDAPLQVFQSLPLKIVGEVTSYDDLCMCVLPGTSINGCHCIMSEMSLLNHCEKFIAALESMQTALFIRQPVWDSAGACHTIRDEQAHKIAVIASEEAAIATNLTIVQRNVPSKQKYVSSHLIIATEARDHIGRVTNLLPGNGIVLLNKKATILVIASDKEQWLLDIMRVFVDLNIHISQVQSVQQNATCKCVAP